MLSIASVLCVASSTATGSPYTGGYTVGNTGGSKPVAVGLRRFFGGRPAKIYLLGRAGGFAFYRVQPTATYRCWASGPASRVGTFTVIGCPNVIGPYPIQFHDEQLGGLPRSHSGGAAPRAYFRAVAGIAADGAVRVGLESGGHVFAIARVVHNLFAFARPLPRRLGGLVAFYADGRRLLPHPGWGHHQTLR